MDGQRVAVVTGGGRGIGLAIVQRLITDGYRIAALDINERAIDEARAETDQLGDVRFFPASVIDRAALETVAAELVEGWGKIDVLVNNAGVNRPGTILTQSDEQWDAVIETNLKGAFVASSVFAPHLVEGGGGAIVNIGSTAASGVDGSPAYATSKAGLIGLTRTMATELGPMQVRVNLVAPGITLTGWVTRNIDAGHIEKMKKSTPLERAAQPEDIAAVVAFLCSDDARHVTGQVISASGGSWMP
ncbi:MAG: SDR family NAD(P)-dependent oxidoreductase [Gammaproteobacteria bacterium]|jgi:3-oxoacyl-[acyl-carrier protein] reductase|nr:SDR family NAD(P)-dependent oxidoreductase [Gammaproteobacteria bacterium]